MSMPWSSLPNLHPAVIHLPLGILPLAVLVDLLSLAARRSPWLDRMAASLYLAGAAGAGFAVWAGRRAADSLVDVPAKLQPQIATHSDWGHYVWYLFALLALARGFVAWRDRAASEASGLPLRIVLALVAVGGLGVLAKASDLGGGLVYVHGLAVERPAPETAPAPRATAPSLGEEPENRLLRDASGGLEWRPVPPDHQALGQILATAHGTSFDAIGPAEAGGRSVGLPLEVDGRVVLRLPGELDDLQVDAELELDGFDGTLGLVHHLGEPSEGGFLLVATDGAASLIDVRDGGSESLDEQPLELPEGVFELSVSSAGRHLKGMVDGRTVVHGHIAPPPTGGYGLVLDGRGVVWIHSVTVTPLGD